MAVGSDGQCRLYARRANVLQFVRDTEAVVQYMKEGESGVALTARQKALLDRPDIRLCAREGTPSRRRICRGIDKAFIRSKQGLFSAIVYRFMSFNSPAFTEYSGPNENCKFSSMDDWKRYYDDLKRNFSSRGEDFYCNPKQIGNRLKNTSRAFGIRAMTAPGSQNRGGNWNSKKHAIKWTC